MSVNEGEPAAVGRSAMRKASARILPLILIGYAIAYIDRVNISFAALQMNADLNFSATVYGIGAGVFFLSYAVFEVPSNLLLARFGARRWIARIMFTWGLLAAGMMFVQTPLQFYIMRFLLGMAEAGFFPGVIAYFAHWFPAEQRGRAIAGFYIAYPLSLIVMGPLSGLLLELDGHLGLHGWQWLFLVQGLPAVVMSVVILVRLTDRPEVAAWLTPAERDWIVAKLKAEAEAHPRAPDHSLLRTLTNPTVWQFAAVNFVVLGANYAFSLSAPTILKEATGLGPLGLGYLTAVAGGIGAVVMLVSGWSSDLTRERYWHVIVPLLLAAAGFGVMAATRVPEVFMAAYVLTFVAGTAFAVAFWLAPGELIHPASIAVSVAAINSIGQFGSFLFPALWGKAHDMTGSYGLGLSLLPVAFGLAAVMVFALWLQVRRLRARAPG